MEDSGDLLVLISALLLCIEELDTTLLAHFGCKRWTGPMVLQLPSRVLEVELTLASSNYHTEMNPSDVGNNDRYVVQEILKVRHCADSTLQVPHIHLCMHGYDL